MADNISYQPTAGLSYDPVDPVYWDARALDGEIERAFELCHGCRMCFKYCDSFQNLFRFVDQNHDGDVRKVTLDERASVMDACFQCKLCEVQCPYTPEDGHEFQLDFPKLVHRYRAQRERAGGVPLKEQLRNKVLGDPDLAGKAARASLGVANVASRNALHRWFFEQVVGVHRDKDLPDFASQSFDAQARKAGVAFDWRDAEVVLFATCFVQHNEPHIGHDALTVLRANGVQATLVTGLSCCGMPAWEHGDLDGLRVKAVNNIRRLLPFVQRGALILGINPTCTMMLRREYPELVAEEDREAAAAIAAATRDVGEFVWSLRKEERFRDDVPKKPELKIAYHAPCHLRAQRVGFKGRDLVRKVVGSEMGTVMECCGHDGTYAMTVEGFEPSQRFGKRAFDDMKDADAEIWMTDCPLAAIQFRQHAGKKPVHPLTVLARSYEPAEED